MKVVVLCGGLGTRLREETEYRPKPMVTIGEHPVLWHIMKLYSHHGFRDFVLCLGYKGEMIKEYFFNYEMLNNNFTIELGGPRGAPRIEYHDRLPETGWRVTLADTGQTAMTGARLYRVARFLDGDRFMLTYGDGVSDLDLSRVLAYHRSHGRIGTVTGVHPPSRFGELIVDGSERVRAFSEKPQVTESYINGGFFVFERAFLDYLEDGDDCVLERTPLERLARDGELMTYIHDGFWACMDTYRDFKALNEIWSAGRAPWRVWDRAAAATGPA
ncbi:MAG TPA: glucose-1-phosphate cytidylyltransferase [Planctomycetota bacterium]|nr:glucose-1-phosphate cytidylyltransferase [Planctomycetota bacterium]